MLENDKYIIKYLDWDTKMFEVKSAKIILKKEISNQDLNDIIKYVRENEYSFITVENKENNNENNKIIKEINNIFLADVNIQFRKYISHEGKIIDKNIIINNDLEVKQDIIEISKESFVYSRFINDSNLNDKKYLVYSQWVKNAFEKEDKFFCYYKENDKINGYILFSIDGDGVVLELIAVNSSSNNKGIGTKLLIALEEFCRNNDIKYINVGTQLNNLNAQNFYEKNGFKHIENNSIYHWWIGE